MEIAARPQVSALRRVVSRVGRTLTTPLLPDDYFEMLSSRWATRELRAEVIAVRRETPDTTTIVLRPAAAWPGHAAGQYLRLGVHIDGIRHWRAYTITSDDAHPDGLLSVTVKRVDGGRVSPWIATSCRPGDTVYLGEAEGTFVVPDPAPERILMLTAGSGITPIWSLLRSLSRADGVRDVVHVHCCRDEEDFIFAADLLAAGEHHDGYRLLPHYRSERERLTPADLDGLVPDWAERTTFLSGPSAMIDAFAAHWTEYGDRSLLHLERFQPVIGGDATTTPGSGGTIRFRMTEFEAESDGRTSILEAGEATGHALPHGCRMGVCHTCKCTLVSGRVRDLRTGEVLGDPGELIRTCVTAPEGPVELDEGHVVMRGTNARSIR
ncbi:ferredoxin reductase [Nocardioides albidus]|uniref:ferredoxin reductase n=1 Tax=Nocardioides albidus TaxID=1517589 RepID=UPI001962197F|nr:ferredoxin reductase [Nocardioides albidus]